MDTAFLFQGEQGSPGSTGQKGPPGPIVSCFLLLLSWIHLRLSSSHSPHTLPFDSPSPAGTSWFAWSAWRPRCQGREGTPRSYRSHRTPRRAGREGRQRHAWASGIPRTKRRDCKCYSLCGEMQLNNHYSLILMMHGSCNIPLFIAGNVWSHGTPRPCWSSWSACKCCFRTTHFVFPLSTTPKM